MSTISNAWLAEEDAVKTRRTTTPPRRRPFRDSNFIPKSFPDNSVALSVVTAVRTVESRFPAFFYTRTFSRGLFS